MAGEVVVGYDGADASRAALEEAIGLAKDLGSAIIAVFGYEVTKMGGEVKDQAKALQERGSRSPPRRSSGRDRRESRPSR